MTIAMDRVTPVAEIESESNHTVVLGSEIVNAGRYYVSKGDEGVIVLIPVDAIPEEERAFYENAIVRERLLRGIVDYAEGKIVDRPDFFGDG